VIVSLLYKMTRRLPSVPAVLLRGKAAKDAELLVRRHENAVLRRQLSDPVRYEPADRFRFAILSGLVDRRRWSEVFLVKPAVGAARPATGSARLRSVLTPPLDSRVARQEW
jgi:hypothetical protein